MQKWIPTFTSKKFDIECPKPDMVDIKDIAHALSQIACWTGHTDRPISVAEHVLRVSWLMEKEGRSPAQCLIGLHMKSPDAYIGHITQPVKYLCPEIVELDSRVWDAITAKFNIVPGMDDLDLVTDYSDRVAKMEALGLHPGSSLFRDLLDTIKDGDPICCSMEPYVAEAHFIVRHEALTNATE